MSPVDTILRLAEEAPAMVRLAEEVSLAVQVDPALLRRARLDLGPCANAGTEADLWFSSLVRNRSPAGFVLVPELAAELRRRLAQDPPRLSASRERVERAHAYLPPALRLEEELLWLSASPDPAAPLEIERRLQSAVAALVRDGRDGIAYWAARALPMLPVEVQSLEPARMLQAGASLRLERDGAALSALAEDPNARTPGWMVPPDFPTTAVHVRLFEDGIELAALHDAPGHAIQVPSTDPLLVEVHWSAAGDAQEHPRLQVHAEDGGAGSAASAWIPVAPGEVARIAGHVTLGVRLRTISGHSYQVRPIARVTPTQGLPPAQVSAEVLFLEHLGWITRVAEKTCSQHGVWGPEAEDFAASVRLRMMADDFAIIRNHRGDSSLKTYLAVVVQSHFRKYMQEQRGRWRPSAAARRLGPPAPDLEALVYRDGHRLDQAGEMLRTSGRTTLSDRELGRLLQDLPAREPLRPRELDADRLDALEGMDRADDRVAGAEAAALRDKVMGELRRAMARLDPEDEIIVRMHFVEGRTLAEAARLLKIEQKPLYRRVKRLRTQLRSYLEEGGVSESAVHKLTEERE